MTGPAAGRVDRTPRPYALGAAALVTGVVAALAVLLATGSAQPLVPGLPDAGPAVRVVLPVARFLVDLVGALTVGLLLLAVVLLPVRDRLLGADAYRAVRAAAHLAGIWAVLAVLAALTSLADILGQPPAQAWRPASLRAFLLAFPQPSAYLLSAVGAALLALLAWRVLAVTSASLLPALALLALLPPLLTGHASAAAGHDTATSSALLHGVGVAAWVGGLAALWWAAARPRHPVGAAALAVAARRFSMLAAWCFGVVAYSGVVAASVRLTGPGDLVTTAYGRVVLLKVVLLGALGGFGWWHRRRVLPRIATGGRAAFARLAAVELLVMAALVGVAAALSRTPPPVPDEPSATQDSTGLLGYELAPYGGVADWFAAWRPDPLVTFALGVAAGLYAVGLRRVRRAGVAWPVGRTVAWFLGLGILAWVMLGGIAAYAPAVFSVHMVQHMAMTMFAPIALALGAPVTLALRALPAARHTDAGPPVWGLREWIQVGLHSPAARFLTHPLVVFVLFVTSTYTVYFTGLYGVALRNHWAHLAMYGHFLLVGLLFAYVVVGVDPAPRRLPYWQRLVLLLATTPFHAFFGVAVLSSADLMVPEWFLALGWQDAGALLEDQRLGGGIAWAVGELVVLVLVSVLFVQWARSDEREARRVDRAADRAAGVATTDGGTPDGVDPELAAYNAMLARLAEHDRASGSQRP